MRPVDPPGAASIRFLSGPLKGQTFPIQQPTITIGRESSNDIVVRDDPRVSRIHARLHWKEGAWSIEKLSQVSVLTVNQRAVQQAPLADQAVVSLGPDTAFVFLLTGAGQTTRAADTPHFFTRDDMAQPPRRPPQPPNPTAPRPPTPGHAAVMRACTCSTCCRPTRAATSTSSSAAAGPRCRAIRIENPTIRTTP